MYNAKELLQDAVLSQGEPRDASVNFDTTLLGTWPVIATSGGRNVPTTRRRSSSPVSE